MDTWDKRMGAGEWAPPGPYGQPEAGHGASGRAGGAAPLSRSAARARRGKRRRLTAIVSVAAAVAVVAGAATAAVAVTRFHGRNAASLNRTFAQLAATPSVTAVANVTPPVAAGSCARPATFSYSGTLSAAVPGVVTYRWLYSTGRPGPVRTIRFARAGRTLVAGQTVAASRAGGGWAELKVLSPVASTSDKAAYRLLCGGGTAGGISITAAVTPATRTAGCVSAPPDFTVTGVIRAPKAEAVTYYWAQSNGRDSAPAVLTFHQAGTEAVRSLAIAPPAASGTGEAVLVVTAPVAAASRPATYTLTCKAPMTPPGGTTPAASVSSPPAAPATTPSSLSSPSSPAGPSSASSPSGPAGPSTPSGPSSPPSSTSPASAPLTIDTDSTLRGVSQGDTYSSSVTVSGGNGPYTWSAAGLPPGLATSPSGNALAISGTATTAGTFNVTLSVTDSSSPARSGTQAITLYITLPPVRATVNAPATAYVGQPFSGTVTVTGGDGTYNWSTTALPQGFVLTAHGATLTISGSPVVGGTPVLEGTVSDGESPAQFYNWVLPLTISFPSS